MRNNTPADVTEEIRWKVIKAMLDEFPTLTERARSYLKESHES